MLASSSPSGVSRVASQDARRRCNGACKALPVAVTGAAAHRAMAEMQMQMVMCSCKAQSQS